MLRRQNKQFYIEDMPFAEFVFESNHPLLQLERAIHWDVLLEELSQFYSKDQGRPTNPLRAQVGTLILKHIKNLSDRDCVNYVKENMYAQRFCGLHPAEVSHYMNAASGLTQFRARIGSEGMAFVYDILNAAAKHKPLKRGDKLILDTTCVPLDIAYPTDIRLLEKCRLKIIKLIQQASRKWNIQNTFRTYNRTARHIFTQFSKLSKPKEKTRKRVHKQMFQFLRRNFKQLLQLREIATEKLGPMFRFEADVAAFLKELKIAENTIRIILHQQALVRKGVTSIHNRIVSLHQPHVRPITRGKFPIPTEFGSKVLLAVRKGYTFVIHALNTNFADCISIAPALRWFKTTFGKFPKEIYADRGFFSKIRVQWIRHCGITSSIQCKGRSAALMLPRNKLQERLIVETRVSLAKRKFGWNRCRARIPDFQASWIALGAAALNVHLAFWPRQPDRRNRRRYR